MDSCLPEERCPAASNTLPLESSPHTETVSPHTTATMPSSTVNNHLLETSFTPPNTSSEPASTDNPPELTPPQISISTTCTVTPGSTPSCQESSMHLVYICL